MTADIDAVLSRLRQYGEHQDAVEVIEELAESERVHVGLYRAANEALGEAEAERDRLREALGEVLRRMTDRGSLGGVDSHLRPTWFSDAEVERLRDALGESPVAAPSHPTGEPGGAT